MCHLQEVLQGEGVEPPGQIELVISLSAGERTFANEPPLGREVSTSSSAPKDPDPGRQLDQRAPGAPPPGHGAPRFVRERVEEPFRRLSGDAVFKGGRLPGTTLPPIGSGGDGA